MRSNPWNGLRTYVEGEPIYGRSGEIHTLSMMILQNSQTVVYGRSGIGKSSVLNAGVFPRVRRKGVFPVYVRFEHNVEKSYLDQIKDAVERETKRPGQEITIRELVAPGQDETLWEYFHRVEYIDRDGDPVRPLIVFDQFEEIFTLENDKGKRHRFFRELTDLINNIRPDNLEAGNKSSEGSGEVSATTGLDLGLDLLGDLNFEYKDGSDFHLVFTLREDFLSYLERNTVGIPALKNNRYCLQPINEEQAAEIIMKPRPGLVDISVAKLIIEKVTREKDFEIDGVPELQVDSAILSLYLSRLYDKMEAEGVETITRELVETHSDNIIEDFYSDAIKGLESGSVQWLEDTLINEDGRRDNRDRSTVLRESGLSEEDLDRLIYDVKLLRQFSYGGDLRVEYIHDVLCPVITDRRQKREENERIKEVERKAHEEKRKSRKRLFTVVSIFLLIALAAGAYWWWYDYQFLATVNSYYADFRLENGWPVGVGEKLSSKQRTAMPLYYKLSHKGHATKTDTEVEICSSNTMLPREERLGWPDISLDPADERGAAYNDILSRVKTIEFEAGEDGRISRMLFADEAAQPLLVMSYFHTGPREAWIQYLAPDGQAFTIRDNEIDRLKVAWDAEGRIANQVYYTALGNTLPIDGDNISGFLWEYPEEGTVVKYYLNNYGQPSQEKAYNMTSTTWRGDTITTTYARAKVIGDPAPVETAGIRGFSKTVKYGDTEDLYLPGNPVKGAVSKETTDSRGNVLRQEITGATTGGFPPVITWKYMGDTGLEIEKIYLTADDKPYGASGDIYLWEKEYTPEGKLISEKRTAADGAVRYAYNERHTTAGDTEITRTETIDRSKGEYLVRVDSVNAKTGRKVVAYYAENDRPINYPVEFGADKVNAHKVITTGSGDETVTEYYEVDQAGKVVPIETVLNPDTYRYTAFRRKVAMDGDNVKAMEISDADGKILTRMMYVVRDGQTIGRAASSVIDGKPVRCPNWEEEGLGYYLIYYSKNFANEYTALQPYDEWWNKSVFYVGGYNPYKEVEFLDFQGKPIEKEDVSILSHYWLSRMRDAGDISDEEVAYLHILSPKSALYAGGNAGLLDGDRLVRVGTWQLGMPEGRLADEWHRLDRRGENVEITVLRKDGAGMKEVRFTAAGAPGETGLAEYHTLRLSNNEKQLFDRYAKK